MTGLELKAKLEERIKAHTSTAADYRRQLTQPDPHDEAALSESVLEDEIDKAHDQIEVLALIRDHIIADEVYLLGEHDLRFADLLPEPDWMDCGCVARSAPAPAEPSLFDEDERGTLQSQPQALPLIPG